MNKFFIAFLSLLVVVAIAGAYFFPRVSAPAVVAGSPVGTTFGNVGFAAITFSLLNSTSTSVLNPTGQFVYVVDSKIACQGLGSSFVPYTGAGSPPLTMSIATTSTANPTPFNYNFAIALNYTIATGTPEFLEASSTTQTATTSEAIGWPANTYMTFTTNATNTATCTVGVGYVGS